MNLKDVFEKSVKFFKDKKMESARLDAELLLSHALKIERLQIYLKYEQPLSETEIEKCREVVRRRAQGESVAYIIGEKGFYGDMYAVGPGVLVPRPETELVVESALDFIKSQNITEPKILDLGAGTGCIGFAILKNSAKATLVSIEKSEKAFQYLKTNLARLDLSERAEIKHADVMSFDSLFDGDGKPIKFDVIVANPPYIAKSDANIQTSVKQFEPHEALFAGTEGYKDLFDWTTKYAKHLSHPGLMLFEMGHLQGPKFKSHFENLKQFSEIKVLKDLSGLDRVLKAVNNS